MLEDQIQKEPVLDLTLFALSLSVTTLYSDQRATYSLRSFPLIDLKDRVHVKVSHMSSRKSSLFTFSASSEKKTQEIMKELPTF